jgi:hypothetical protein
MKHTLKKKKKIVGYSSIHQKIARKNSGNTITAKAYLRRMDKQNDNKEKT